MHPLEAALKQHFGVTDSLAETGYILTDGTFVDLSGRHYASGYVRRGDRFVPRRNQPDYLQGNRHVDHRELPEEVVDALGASGGEGMLALMATTGVLRVMPGTGFSVAKMPTVESVSAFMNAWERHYSGEPLFVDVILVGETRDSVEFNSPTVEQVLGYLESRFERHLGSTRRR